MKYLLEKDRGTGSYHAPYGIDHSAKNQTQQDIFLLEEKQRLQTEVAQGQLAAYVPSSVGLSACDRRTCSSSQRLQDLDRAMAVQAK